VGMRTCLVALALLSVCTAVIVKPHHRRLGPVETVTGTSMSATGTVVANEVRSPAFVSDGGLAASIGSKVLMLDGVPAAPLLRVENPQTLVNGKGGSDVLLVLQSVPKRVRSWLRQFINGQYVNRDVALLIPTEGTGINGISRQYSRWDLSNVLITSVFFPALGSSDAPAQFKIAFQYSNAVETKHQRPASVLDAPVRGEFFKLRLDGQAPTFGDTKGAALALTVTDAGSITLTRGTGSGYGAQSATSVGLTVSTRPSSLAKWRQWTVGTDRGLVRFGSLQLFHWTASRYDSTELGRGQLRPLMTIDLNSLVISKADLGSGSVTLKATTLSMPTNAAAAKRHLTPVPAASTTGAATAATGSASSSTTAK